MSGGYDFSQLFHGSLVVYSPGTTFLATSYEDRIIVRSTSTLQIVRTWSCSSNDSCPSAASGTGLPQHPSSSSSGATTKGKEVKIDTLEWSSDSMYLLAFSSATKRAWVYGLAEDGDGESGELALIGGEGVDGLVKVEWGRGGGQRDVLAWSDHGLKLSFYNLSTGTAKFIQSPKSHHSCHTYSPDCRHLAIAEKHLGKEYIGIYDTLDGYTLFRHFALLTNDVQGISWSPCGKYIAAWDSPLSYSVHVHSPIGPHLTHFSAESATFSPSSHNEDPGLGVRTLSWAPGGRFLVLGGWDGRARVIESEGWRCIALLQWGSKTTEKDVTVWREPSDWLKDTRGRGIVQFDRMPLPALLPSVRPEHSRPHPRIGVIQLSFDRDGTLLLVRLESSPNVIHIHTFLPEPTSESPHITHLTSLIFTNPVRKAEWCPSITPSSGAPSDIDSRDSVGQGTGSENASSSKSGPKSKRIAVVTRDAAVYFWDGESGWVDESAEMDASSSSTAVQAERGGMVEGVGIPAQSDFSPHSIAWAPDGTSLSIQDRDKFCLLYDDNDEGTDDVNDGADVGNTLHQSSKWTGFSMSSEREMEEGLTHINEEDEDYEEGWSAYGLEMREGLRAGTLVA